MKFSEFWLREWVDDVSINNHQLIDQLTMIGFQVEESKPVYEYKFYNIVIGMVVEYKIHPNLINTWIITVNNGSERLIKIISKNIISCRDTFRVVVANVGAVLPNGRVVDPVFIGKEKSEGLLCTYSMLKLNNCTKDLIELPEDAPVGFNFYDYLDLNDNIININIPPNRGDCFNVIGLSREIASVNQLELKTLQINDIPLTIDDSIPIVIETPEQCPKFLGRIVKNINISVITPLRIQEKLRRCGVCPINVVMDIINYVLLELGYPIYVFDYDKIDQNAIYIRYSRFGEVLEVSDHNINLELCKDTLIISDCYKPLAIAGVIIGNQFDISAITCNILLQSAFFDPSIITKQSAFYNLNTVTSIRHVQGIDVNLSELALNYVTSLLLKICNGYAGPITNIINNNYLPKSNSITLHKSKLEKILGFHIIEQRIELILKNLKFQVSRIQNSLWEVLPPSWRCDITIEEDLIAEIIRIYGYDKIPKVSLINSFLTEFYFQPNIISLSRIKTALVDRGYHEVITYSFVNPNIQKLLYPKDTSLKLMNPMSLDMSVMRLSLWPGLIKTVIYNQNRQQKHIMLFEIGICFVPDKMNKNTISQKLMISGIRYGLRFNEHWDLIESIVDFYDIKGDVEYILNIIFNKCSNNIIFKVCQHSALHPKQNSAIYLDKVCIGYIGMIHPTIQNKLDLHLNTLMFELHWDVISKIKLPIKISDISKFPKNYRDISLIVPTYINAEDIINTCKTIDSKQLIDVKLIDVYTGGNILKGYKSFTIKLILQDQTHTLQEEEILKIVNKCITILKKYFHVIVR